MSTQEVELEMGIINWLGNSFVVFTNKINSIYYCKNDYFTKAINPYKLIYYYYY